MQWNYSEKGECEVVEEACEVPCCEHVVRVQTTVVHFAKAREESET
jgi:hypothetical protein